MLEWTISRTIEDASSSTTRHAPEWLLSAQRSGLDEPHASLRLRFGVGAAAPRHWFHLGTLLHSAPEIGVTTAHRTLTLCSDLCGSVEMFDCRGSGEAVALLVRAAALWLARDMPGARSLFAERPGVVSRTTSKQSSRSAFFDDVLSHFVREDDAFDVSGEPRWHAISGMLPRHPLYLGMLEPDLQALIGHLGAESDWDRALADEGFATGRTVTVMHASPVYEADLALVATFRAATRRTVEPIHADDGALSPMAPRQVMVIDDRCNRVFLVNGWCDAGVLRVWRGTGHEEILDSSEVWCA